VQRNFRYVDISAGVNLHLKLSDVGATGPWCFYFIFRFLFNENKVQLMLMFVKETLKRKERYHRRL